MIYSRLLDTALFVVDSIRQYNTKNEGRDDASRQRTTDVVDNQRNELSCPSFGRMYCILTKEGGKEGEKEEPKEERRE